MKKLLCALTFGAAFMCGDAYAWGSDGHSTIGAMADQLLKGTHAEKQVRALLLPGENLENVANWMDCVKGNYCGRQTPEMIEYTNANPMHAEYHYTNIPFQEARYRDGAVGSTDHDIVQSLKQAILVLQGKGNDTSNSHRFTRRQALLLIAHLAGDIQQPLHVGDAYVGKSGGFVVPELPSQIDGVKIGDTRGGNELLLDEAKLSVVCASQVSSAVAAAPPTASLPFHAYWDFTVVGYAMQCAGAATPQQFAQLLIAGKPAVAGNTGDPSGWPYQWADDTLHVAKLAYANVVPGPAREMISRKGEKYTVWTLALPNGYPSSSTALAKTQLIKGGYRLAALLEAIWP